MKQWDKLEAVDGQDALVETYTGNAIRQVVHPSYQAWSYAVLINDYNQSVQEKKILLKPCAYLHNHRRRNTDPIDAEQYSIYQEDAPAFTRGQVDQLRKFIKKSVVKGDKKEILYEVEHGKIRPSKSLQDSIAKMFQGNQEFVMLDEQKVVYENILTASRKSMDDGIKRVIIVEGGPGTGKLLSQLIFLQNLPMKISSASMFQKTVRLETFIRKS